jgi:hypothetical protein
MGFGVPNKAEDMKDSNYWRYMFGVTLLLAVLHLIIFVLFFNYDTPKFLKMTGQTEKLDELLRKIYHKDDVEMVKEYMDKNAS